LDFRQKNNSLEKLFFKCVEPKETTIYSLKEKVFLLGMIRDEATGALGIKTK